MQIEWTPRPARHRHPKTSGQAHQRETFDKARSQGRYDGLEHVAGLFIRADGSEWLVVLRADRFFELIVRWRANYQFTRALSLRAIVDYNSVLANPQLIAQEKTKQLTGDILLTYLLNPGTALYIGYTDRYENLALDPTLPPSLRLQRIGEPTTSTGRQFFIKLSYLFRF
jgi:hypothetical protein